jgi:gamma-resorcylate decarboxylase
MVRRSRNTPRPHLLDVEDRIALMDKTGIERAVLSLTSTGVQSILDTETAVRVACDTNDAVHASYVDKFPDRLSMFACLPTQDPGEAAAELERAVHDFGAVGALINGYTNVGDNQTGRYLDDPAYAPLWSKDAELDVPVYLHPREPLPAQTRIDEAYSSLVGSAWGFA